MPSICNNKYFIEVWLALGLLDFVGKCSGNNDRHYFQNRSIRDVHDCHGWSENAKSNALEVSDKLYHTQISYWPLDLFFNKHYRKFENLVNSWKRIYFPSRKSKNLRFPFLYLFKTVFSVTKVFTAKLHIYMAYLDQFACYKQGTDGS